MTYADMPRAALLRLLRSKVKAAAADAIHVIEHANDGTLPGIQWALAWSEPGNPLSDWHRDTICGWAHAPEPLLSVAVSSLAAAGKAEAPLALALLRVDRRGRALATYDLRQNWSPYAAAWQRALPVSYQHDARAFVAELDLLAARPLLCPAR